MAGTPDTREFEALTELEELRKVATDLQARLRKANAQTAELVEAAHEGSKAAALLLGNPPPVKPPKKQKQHRDGRPEVALLHLSDWQIGKKTDSYSTEVALARLDLVAEKLLELARIEASDHPVDECHILLGGDMVEGTQIFPGQQWEIDSGLFEQVFAAVGAIVLIVRTALSHFQKVHVWEVEGNHGRLGKRGDYPRGDNADLFIYREARTRLADDRLVWHPRERWYQIVEIGAYRALLVHGDQIKQFGGNTPAFGISRKVNAWASGVVEPFTDCYLGHFHQPLTLPIANGGRAFVNPSTESGSVYAQEFVAATGVPGQRLHFVDPRRGRTTSERLIWLDDR